MNPPRLSERRVENVVPLAPLRRRPCCCSDAGRRRLAAQPHRGQGGVGCVEADVEQRRRQDAAGRAWRDRKGGFFTRGNGRASERVGMAGAASIISFWGLLSVANGAHWGYRIPRSISLLRHLPCTLCSGDRGLEYTRVHNHSLKRRPSPLPLRSWASCRCTPPQTTSSNLLWACSRA